MTLPSSIKTVNPEDGALDKNGFVGVDPVYQNFANKTDAPLGEAADEEDDEDEDAEDDKPAVVTPPVGGGLGA